MFTHFYKVHNDCVSDSGTSLLSHRTVTAWCSTSSSLAGQPTGTRLSLSAPSCSWSGGWPSGRSSTTEETGGPWYTACKSAVHTHKT